MKGLSIEEKAKRYDEAIIRCSRLWESDMITRENYEYIFPELKESEDEEIKEMLKVAVERTPWMQDKKEKCYEWLEKQGEQKTVDDLTQQEAMDIAVAECFEQGEQKPTNKVEPKLKVEEGKWYVCTKTFTLRGKIVVIKGQTYKSNQDGAIEGEDEYLFIDKLDGKASDYFRPWTIHDAKDGEILVFGKEKHPFIFKGLLDKSHPDNPVAYCGIDCDNKFYIPTGINWWTDDTDIHPATKGQRDLLFQKMHESGYEWDAEKKELKKIKQNPANEVGNYDHKEVLQIIINEQKPAWSEEDEKILDRVITNYESGYLPSVEKRDEIIEKLKSLKERYTWKPSDEQMEGLECTIKTLRYQLNAGDNRLDSLYNDLKKLREE